MSGVVDGAAARRAGVLPTDTVYGLCCDAADARAAERLYALKGATLAAVGAARRATSSDAPRGVPELATRR